MISRDNEIAQVFLLMMFLYAFYSFLLACVGLNNPQSYPGPNSWNLWMSSSLAKKFATWDDIKDPRVGRLYRKA